MPGPGDFLDPSMWPLFMQSGMMQAPPQGRTAPSDLDMNDPFARAAYRQQQSVQPDFGRAGNGPSLANVLGMTPLGSIDRMVQAGTEFGPEVVTGGLSAPRKMVGMEMSTPAFAAGSEFNEPQPQRPTDVQSQLDKLKKDLAPLQTKFDRLKANFEGGRIDKNEYNRQRVPLESQIERGKSQITEIDSPYQRQLTDWETRKSESLRAQEMATQQSREKSAFAQLPFRQKYPDATQAIVGGGNALTGLAATTAGLMSKGKLGPTVGAMGLGGLEGAVTANIPEWLDLAGGQPIGSDAWNKTRDQQLSLDNLVKTGAEAGIHASQAGAIGYTSSLGPKVAQRIKNYFSPSAAPPPLMPGSPSASMGMPQASQGPTGTLSSTLATPPAIPQSPPLMVRGSSGLWHYGAGSGKTGVVPKTLWPRPEAPPPLMGE